MELQIVATLGVGILTTALGIFIKLGFNGIQKQFEAMNARLTDIHNDLNNIKTDVRTTNQNLIAHLAQHD